MKIENLWIIDDDHTLVSLFELTVKSEGINVETSSMCQEAIKVLSKNLKRSNLVILLDHNLPDNRNGGLLIAQNINKELECNPELQIPIVFSVSYGNYDTSYCQRKFKYHEGIETLISLVGRIPNIPLTR